MTLPEHEQRITNLESRMDTVEGDALAARHLSAAVDRDHSWMKTEMRGIKRSINALSQQTAERFAIVNEQFDAVDARFDAVDARFDAMDGELADLRTELRGGLGTITGLLNRLIERDK